MLTRLCDCVLVVGICHLVWHFSRFTILATPSHRQHQSITSENMLLASNFHEIVSVSALACKVIKSQCCLESIICEVSRHNASKVSHAVWTVKLISDHCVQVELDMFSLRCLAHNWVVTGRWWVSSALLQVVPWSRCWWSPTLTLHCVDTLDTLPPIMFRDKTTTTVWPTNKTSLCSQWFYYVFTCLMLATEKK